MMKKSAIIFLLTTVLCFFNISTSFATEPVDHRAADVSISQIVDPPIEYDPFTICKSGKTITIISNDDEHLVFSYKAINAVGAIVAADVSQCGMATFEVMIKGVYVIEIISHDYIHTYRVLI